MKRTPIRSLFACLSLIFVAGAADAQQHENYCNSLKTLLQSAKDGFAQAQNLKMAGASVCNVENDTRSYGCMWTFDKSPLAAAGYQCREAGSGAEAFKRRCSCLVPEHHPKAIAERAGYAPHRIRFRQRRATDRYFARPPRQRRGRLVQHRHHRALACASVIGGPRRPKLSGPKKGHAKIG